MTKQEFVLKLLQEGREWLQLLLPFVVGWHMKQPKWVRKNDDSRNS